MDKALDSTDFIDHDSNEIQELVKEFRDADLTPKEQAVRLYYKVRDGWMYNPYAISFEKEKLKASYIYHQPAGHCIDKSILYIAGLRALGIPAKLHLAKVKNHIAVESLTEKFGTNELTPHGMVDIWLNNKWVKASPAFNLSLCIKSKVDPLDFDGEHDSLFQEYNKEQKQFMEYTADYGTFDDVPVDFIIENMKAHYPDLIKEGRFILRTE